MLRGKDTIQRSQGDDGALLKVSIDERWILQRFDKIWGLLNSSLILKTISKMENEKERKALAIMEELGLAMLR